MVAQLATTESKARSQLKILPSFIGQREPARRAGLVRIFTGKLLPRLLSRGAQKKATIRCGNYSMSKAI